MCSRGSFVSTLPRKRDSSADRFILFLFSNNLDGWIQIYNVHKKSNHYLLKSFFYPTGYFKENPFHYQKIGLRQFRIVRRSRAVKSFDTTVDCREYVATMKAMNSKEENPAPRSPQFQNHYILVFDLTSLQDAGENIHFPELSGESLERLIKMSENFFTIFNFFLLVFCNGTFVCFTSSSNCASK